MIMMASEAENYKVKIQEVIENKVKTMCHKECQTKYSLQKKKTSLMKLEAKELEVMQNSLSTKIQINV